MKGNSVLLNWIIICIKKVCVQNSIQYMKLGPVECIYYYSCGTDDVSKGIKKMLTERFQWIVLNRLNRKREREKKILRCI